MMVGSLYGTKRLKDMSHLYILGQSHSWFIARIC